MLGGQGADFLTLWSIRSSVSLRQFIPIWWCRFFSWEPTTKVNNFEILKSPICTCYIHASLRTQDKFWFNIIFLWCINVGQQESSFYMFSWGVKSLEHICTSKPRKNMTHDCLRGHGSLHDFTRLGTRMLIFGNGDIMIIFRMLNLHRSDNFRHQEQIQTFCVNAHPNYKTCFFCWKHICLSLQKDTNI